MKSKINILKYFYNCCHLPITLIDDDFNIIYKEGFTATYNLLFKNSLILNNLKINIPLNSSLKINHDNSNFLIVPFGINEKSYYIIGPYLTNSNSENLNSLPKLNENCIKYIENLLIDIINDNNKETSITSPNIERVIEIIESNTCNSLCISSICSELNMNQCYFCRLFKAETGLTFTQYVNTCRIEKSKKLLKDTDLSLLDIALEVGFGSQSYFSTVFKKICGINPLDYRNSI